MSEIKDRQDADPDIDYIVAALADDTTAAAAVEGLTEPEDAPLVITDETIATPTLAASTDDHETGDAASAAEDVQAAEEAEIDDDVDGEADDRVETASETDIIDEIVAETVAAPEIAASQAEIEAVVASDIAAALEADMAPDAPEVVADAEAAPTTDEAEPPGAEILAIAEPAATTSAVYADTVVDIETTDDADEDDAPLLDDELEHGIASVFAALQSAARSDGSGEGDEPAGPLSDSEASDGVTFRLLGELDRLWHRAA